MHTRNLSSQWAILKPHCLRVGDNCRHWFLLAETPSWQREDKQHVAIWAFWCVFGSVCKHLIGFTALVAKLDEMFLWAVVNDLLGAGWLLYAWGRHFKTCRAQKNISVVKRRQVKSRNVCTLCSGWIWSHEVPALSCLLCCSYSCKHTYNNSWYSLTLGLIWTWAMPSGSPSPLIPSSVPLALNPVPASLCWEPGEMALAIIQS